MTSRLVRRLPFAAGFAALGFVLAFEIGGAAQSSTVVIVGAGDMVADCTTGNSIANANATAMLIDGIPGVPVFTLGDNQYNDGTYTEFTSCYDQTWGRFKSRTHPVTGNHDYNTAGAKGYFDYFNGVNVQTGPAGDRSGGYYSYNVGSWHIVVLNSECASTGLWDPGGCDVGSPQEQWLRADLAASPTNNIIAMWHKPRYSSGWKETSVQPLWQALYDYGADLVLNGHVHYYERLAPANANLAKDTTYGIRQIVVGTGGKSLQSASSSPVSLSEVNNGTSYGVIKLTLSDSSYSWQFIPIPGDSFTDSGTTAVHGPPPSGLVASWQMEENGGSTLVDSSGYGNNAAISGAPRWVSGVVGLALSLDGNTYALAPNTSSLNPGKLTLAAWVNPSRLATQYVVKKSSAWEISISSSGVPYFRLNGSSTYTINATSTQSLGSWMHLAGTYDGSRMHFYVNGVEQGTGIAGPSSIASNSNKVGVGAQSDGSGRFQGLLDDVRVYNNKVLSASDIQALASEGGGSPPPTNQAPVVNAGTDQTITFGTAATLSGTVSDDGLPNPPGTVTTTWSQFSGPGTTTFGNASALSTTATFSAAGTYSLQLSAFDGALTSTDKVTINVTTSGGGGGGTTTLVGYYKADEGGGTVLVDSSGLGNNGAISLTPTWITGVSGLAIRWGASAYAIAPNNSSLNITGPVSLAAWVRPEATSSAYTQVLIKKGSNTSGAYELGLSSDGKAYVRLNNSSTYRLESASSYPTNGTWMHLAATYDGSVIRLYVNGVQETSTAGPASISSNTLGLAIGATTDAIAKYKGAIDEGRVYSGALSATDIATLAGK